MVRLHGVDQIMAEEQSYFAGMELGQQRSDDVFIPTDEERDCGVEGCYEIYYQAWSHYRMESEINDLMAMVF